MGWGAFDGYKISLGAIRFKYVNFVKIQISLKYLIMPVNLVK